MTLTPILVAYVPSPHRGYVNFFRKYAGGVLYVLGPDLIAEHTSLVRNLPANDPTDVRSMIESLGIFSRVEVLYKSAIECLHHEPAIVMPDEDVSRAVANRYFADLPVSYESVWLRWHKDAALLGKIPEHHRFLSTDALDQELMAQAKQQSTRSSDWWRQVGAVLAKDGKPILVGFNKHQPSEHTPYLLGDPRSNFEPGERIDLSSALHAETGVIAAAAARGIATKGASLYVTTFPCPGCAYAIRHAQIRKLFYAEGYSLVHGDQDLRAAGIEIVRVQCEAPLS